MSASSVTGLSKMLTSDGANFLSECEKAFGDGQERVSKVSPGPAEYLGFDVKCNVAIQGEASHTSAVVLSREFVAEKFFWCGLACFGRFIYRSLFFRVAVLDWSCFALRFIQHILSLISAKVGRESCGSGLLHR